MLANNMPTCYLRRGLGSIKPRYPSMTLILGEALGGRRYVIHISELLKNPYFNSNSRVIDQGERK